MTSEYFDRCPSCGRFTSLEDGYYDLEDPFNEFSLVRAFCDGNCSEHHRAVKRGDECFFCGAVAPDLCAVCDRDLCQVCAVFHGFEDTCANPFEFAPKQLMAGGKDRCESLSS